VADSILFDGTDDRIVLTIGNVSSSGSYTVAVAAKLVANEAAFKDLLAWEFPGNASIGFDNASPHHLNVYGGSGPNSATSTFTCPASDGWCIYAYNRTAGSTGRLHKYVFGTDTWTHEANANTIASDAAGAIHVGANDGPAQFFDGNILIAGWWNSSLADGTIENLDGGYAAWVNAAPAELWRFNGTTNMTATVGISQHWLTDGTSVDTGDVPATWNDHLFDTAWIAA
jgi:hypothetical protein